MREREEREKKSGRKGPSREHTYSTHPLRVGVEAVCCACVRVCMPRDKAKAAAAAASPSAAVVEVYCHAKMRLFQKEKTARSN